MKLEGLQIGRRESYYSVTPEQGQLYGEVLLIGDAGKQTIKLSPMAILRLFQVIEAEVCVTAKKVAEQVPDAFVNAAGEQALLVHPLAAAQVVDND